MKLAIAATILIGTVAAISVLPSSARSASVSTPTPTTTPCAPHIDSLTPTEGQLGTTVSLFGSCFGEPNLYDTWVIIGREYFHSIGNADWTDTVIRLQASSRDSGPVTLAISNAFGVSNTVEFLVYNYVLPRPDTRLCPPGELHIRVNPAVDVEALVSSHGDILDGLLSDHPALTEWWRVSILVGSEVEKTLEYAAEPSVEWVQAPPCYIIDDPTIVPTASPATSPLTLPNTGGRP